MKVLIWILCAFVIILINEVVGLMIGFKLGYLIVFLLISAASTAMCKFFLGEEKKDDKKKVSGGKNAPAVPVPGGWTCPKCGAAHEPTTNFCDKCGTPKSAPAQPAIEMTRPQPIEAPKPVEPVLPVEPVQPIAPVAPVQPEDLYQPIAPMQPQQPQYNPYPQPNVPQGAAAPSIKFYVSSMNTEVSVTRPSFTVGRDATSDLSLARLPNAKYIARRQASFFCSGGKWYIRDENSTNGTFLNNKQLQGQVPHPLSQGDFISFAGKETLIVQQMTK